MVIKHFRLTFTPDMADQPIVANLCKSYNFILTIRSAHISEKGGWILVSLHGELDEVQRAVAALGTVGVNIAPTHLPPFAENDNALP